MVDSAHKGFDFNEWSYLAKTDMQAFEDKRRHTIDQAILRLSSERQQRLRGLQWRIDQVRERASNPMAACLEISSMMWDSLLGENGLLEAINSLGEAENIRTYQQQEPQTATILPFKPNS
jgi:hypothetical protein